MVAAEVGAIVAAVEIVAAAVVAVAVAEVRVVELRFAPKVAGVVELQVAAQGHHPLQ